MSEFDAAYSLTLFSHLLFCAPRSEKTDVESTHSSSNCSAQNAANANKAIYGQGLQVPQVPHGQQGQEVPLTMSIPPDALYGVVEKRNAVIQAPPNHFLQVKKREENRSLEA